MIAFTTRKWETNQEAHCAAALKMRNQAPFEPSMAQRLGRHKGRRCSVLQSSTRKSAVTSPQICVDASCRLGWQRCTGPQNRSNGAAPRPFANSFHTSASGPSPIAPARHSRSEKELHKRRSTRRPRLSRAARPLGSGTLRSPRAPRLLRTTDVQAIEIARILRTKVAITGAVESS